MEAATGGIGSTIYRNLNEIRIEHGMPLVNSLYDPIGNEVNNRTLFVKIHNEVYPISCEVLDMVFSRIGVLDKIQRLPSGFHSTVRFLDKESTLRAYESFNGRNIYDNCCQMELFLVKDPMAGASKIEIPVVKTHSRVEEPEKHSQDSVVVDELKEDLEEIEAQIVSDSTRSVGREFVVLPESFMSCGALSADQTTTSATQEVAPPTNPNSTSTPIDVLGDVSKEREIDSSTALSLLQESGNHLSSCNFNTKGETKIPKASPIEDPENPNPAPHTQPNQVTSNPCSAMIFECPSKELGELIVLLIELIEIRMENWRKDSIECLKTPSAHKVFVKMPSRGVHLTMGLLVCSDRHSCEPIGFDFEDELKQNSITLSYDRGKETCVALARMITIDARVGVCDTKRERSNVWSFSSGRYPVVFDPGGFDALPVSKKDGLNRRMISWLDLSSSIMSIRGGYRWLDGDLILILEECFARAQLEC